MFCEGPLLSLLVFRFHSFIVITWNDLLPLLYVHILAYTQRKQTRQRAQLACCSRLRLTPSAQHHALCSWFWQGQWTGRLFASQSASNMAKQSASRPTGLPELWSRTLSLSHSTNRGQVWKWGLMLLKYTRGKHFSLAEIETPYFS